MRSLIKTFLLFALAAAGTAPAGAQTVGPLGPPLYSAPVGFTSVFDVAEMDDHRILLVDNREAAVVVLDLEAGTEERLGRQGGGPREYRSAFSILRFGGDTLGVYDSRQRRFLLLVDGEIVGTRLFPPPPLRGFSVPRGPDPEGGFWLTSRRIGENGLERAEFVYRWRPDQEALELVDSIMAYGPGQARRGMIPMARGDGWSLLADGTLARVVAEDYRVEWTTVEGRRTTGPRIAHDPVPVDERERLAWLRAVYSAPSASVRLVDPDGSSGDRDDPELARRRREFPLSTFPKYVPPFEPDWLPASPDGELWITRNGPADADHTVVDVVARDGRLRHRLRVPGRVRVVAVSEERVYMVRRDEVDLEWLEAFTRP